MADIYSPQEYIIVHKTAFREAFNFLSAHFPPVHSEEWWTQTMKEMAELDSRYKEEPLLRELLLAITAYLEKESRLRKKEDA